MPVEEEEDYKSKDKIMKKAKPLHNHLYKNLHKGDTEGDVNESRHFSWREELRELVDVTSSKPKTDEKSREKISEKKVKNKIVINPPQGMTEAIEELGGQILEMVEIEEAVYGGTPKKKEEPKDTRMTVTNADKKGNTPAYQNYKRGDKRYKSADHMDEAAGGIIGGAVGLMKAAKAAKAVKGISTAAKLASASSALAPVAKASVPAGAAAAAGAAGGYALGKSTNKKKQVTTTTTTEEVGSTSTDSNPETKKQLAAKEQMMRKQQLLSRQRLQMQKQGKLPAGHMEGLSVDDQMKISQDYNRMSPEEKKAANKKALGTIKKVKREKDTRTDAQKMTDATGPRPGSRYRGD